MIILNRNSLTATGSIAPETMSLQMKERETSATITMENAEGITVGSWLKDNTEPGAGIVYSVRSIQHTFNARTQTINLEHIISILKDKILFGEIKPSTITGNPQATICTARQAVEYILAQQGDWMLGDFDYDDVSNPYKFDGETLFDALETVTKTLEDAWWTYDMSAYPFALNIIRLDDDVDSELRAGRNLKTISRTIDRSEMYTRFYPIGKDDLHITGNYVEKNASTYGVISKVETDTSLTTEAELIAWANERLDAHAQPVVTIQAEGVELSRETGADLDELTIGRICRAPLPEFDTTIQERIIEKRYQDKISEPENVQITMANSRTDVTKIIAEALKKSGRSSRISGRQSKNDHAWIEDTNDHVSLVAEAIVGVDAQGNPNWERISELTVDGNGIEARVIETENGMVTVYSAIQETSSQIYIVVGNATSDLRSYIDVTAEGIEIASAAASSTMYSVIETTATNIRTEVSRRAKVFIQINNPALDPAIRPTLREGDIWIKSSRVQSWDDMGSRSWEDASQLDWNKYNGAEQFVWDGVNERWEPVSDRGLLTEWGTRIDQTERNITLLATAIGMIDPSAIASIDVSAEAITLAVSSAKSELYSIIKQTSTSITQEVVNNIEGISSFVLQSASELIQAVARKNKVFVQLTDPANDNTVIDGDIWIKSSGDDNIHPTWGELSAKTWASQNSTNWREYYEGYWYARKNGKWERMNAEADVVEIGTRLEQDEKHIALVARDVDRNHVELGSRLEVTARSIRGEVHASKSDLYSVIMQTATSIVTNVTSVTDGLSSTITQTKSQIALVVTKKDGQDVIDTASIVAGINAQTGSFVKIAARNINLSGYVTADSLSTNWLKSLFANITLAQYNTLDGATVYASSSVQSKEFYFDDGDHLYTLKDSIRDLQIVSSGGTYTLQRKRYNDSGWVNVGSFSRAVSSWGWAGGNGKIQVTAYPQDQSLAVDVRVSGQSSITSNGTYTYKVQYEDNQGSYWDTGAALNVSVELPSRTLRCTSADPTYPGSSTKAYIFRLEGNYNFSAGNNYTFYRSSW